MRSCPHGPFCQRCLLSYLDGKTSASCPMCGQPATRDLLAFDERARRAVESVLVECDLRGNGCLWEGPFSAFSEHRRVSHLQRDWAGHDEDAVPHVPAVRSAQACGAAHPQQSEQSTAAAQKAVDGPVTALAEPSNVAIGVSAAPAQASSSQPVRSVDSEHGTCEAAEAAKRQDVIDIAPAVATEPLEKTVAAHADSAADRAELTQAMIAADAAATEAKAAADTKVPSSSLYCDARAHSVSHSQSSVPAVLCAAADRAPAHALQAVAAESLDGLAVSDWEEVRCSPLDRPLEVLTSIVAARSTS